MAATVQIDMSYGSTETVASNVSNLDMGSIDGVVSPVSNPIAPGDYTYEKVARFHVTDMGGSLSVKNFRLWVSNAINTGWSVNFGTETSYVAPVNTASTVATTALSGSASDPVSANVPIAGSLSGELTAAGYTDYFVLQAHADSTVTSGNTFTFAYAYDEVS